MLEDDEELELEDDEELLLELELMTGSVSSLSFGL